MKKLVTGFETATRFPDARLRVHLLFCVPESLREAFWAAKLELKYLHLG